MKTRGVSLRALGRPKYYLAESSRRIKIKKRPDRPLPLGEFYAVGSQPGGGWARFIPPKESIEVRLKIPQGGKPYEAMREWFIRRKAKRTRRSKEFSLAALAPVWNLGGSPNIEDEGCTTFHLGGSRITQSPAEAYGVWEDSDFQGIHPAHILAILDPEHRMPFLPSPGRPTIPSRNRWLHIPIDLALPLGRQFAEARKRVEEIRDYAFLIARLLKPRPGRQDLLRKVRIFTLHYSARRSVPEIAQEIFNLENQDAAREKVKEILKEVRRALADAGLQPPTLSTHRRR